MFAAEADGLRQLAHKPHATDVILVRKLGGLVRSEVSGSESIQGRPRPPQTFQDVLLRKGMDRKDAADVVLVEDSHAGNAIV